MHWTKQLREAFAMNNKATAIEILDRPEIMAKLAKIDTWEEDAPLHWAIYLGHFDYVKMVIDKGIKINSLWNWVGWEKVKITALEVAIKHNSFVEYLLEEGADPNVFNNNNEKGWEWTSLHRAISNKDIALIRLLVKHGADPAFVGKIGKLK